MTEIHFGNLESEMRKGRAAACRAFLESVPQTERRGAEYLDALARFHFRLSEFAQAVSISQEIVRLHPRYSDHRYVLFDCCAHLGWFEAARQSAETMAAIHDKPAATMIQAEMLYAMGLDDEAVALGEALERYDHYAAMTQMTRSHATMRRDGLMRGLGAYRRAWTDPRAWDALYGAGAGGSMSDYWHGQQPLPKRMVLRGRGGVGDTFQWMRYLPLLVASGVELVGVDERAAGIRFKPLTRRADIDWARMRLGDWGVARSGETMWTEPFTLFTALFPALGYADIPGGHLETTRDEVADGLLRSIRAEANGRPAVAVTWSSDESHLVFASKSLTLDQIEPLLAMGDIHWVVCQRGLQRQAWLETDLAATSTVLPATLDFAQTGAVLKGLDAVVTNCSSIAHLSGGLGCRTFMLASAAADWRWEGFPSTTPWYREMRIIRQPGLGDWNGAVSRLRAALRSWIGGGSDGTDAALDSADLQA